MIRANSLASIYARHLLESDVQRLVRLGLVGKITRGNIIMHDSAVDSVDKGEKSESIECSIESVQ